MRKVMCTWPVAAVATTMAVFSLMAVVAASIGKAGMVAMVVVNVVVRDVVSLVLVLVRIRITPLHWPLLAGFCFVPGGPL